MKHEQIKAVIKAQYNIIRRLENILKDIPVRLKDFNCPAEAIIEETNKVFDTDCRVKGRYKNLVMARHCACYLMSVHTTLSLHEIAFHFGNVHHTTALHSINIAQDIIDTDEDYAAKVNLVKKNLEERFN